MILGRQETFAFEAQPLAGPPPEGDRAAAALWTAIRLHVAGRKVFGHSRDDRLVRDEVNWPAIGLARWWVRAWLSLFHAGPWPRPSLCRNARDFARSIVQAILDDVDLPDALLDARDAFVASHSLRAAASGASLPDSWFGRDRGVMSIAWNDSMDGDLSFTLPRGEADVPDVDFAEAVRWAPPRIERTANAFAIELLLPAAGVEQTVGRIREAPTDDDVKALMDHFQLGITAVNQHLRNLANPHNR